MRTDQAQPRLQPTPKPQMYGTIKPPMRRANEGVAVIASARPKLHPTYGVPNAKMAMSRGLSALDAPPKLCQQCQQLGHEYQHLVTSYYKAVLALCDIEKLRHPRIKFQNRLDACYEAKDSVIFARLRLESHRIEMGVDVSTCPLTSP